MRSLEPMDVSDESLDLAAIARTLRRSRALLAAGTFVGAILGAGATAVLAKYVSEGIYTLGSITQIETPAQPRAVPTAIRYRFTKGISLQDFKTIYPQLDEEHFRRFVERRHIEPASITRLLKLVTAPNTRGELLAPVYGATRADLRELGEQSKPVENLALAIQISYASSDPLDAAKGTRLLGEFVGESLFASEAAALVLTRVEQHESLQLALDNRVIQTRFTLGTMGDKVKELQAVRHEFPNVTEGVSRQVVSVADGGARYLSPDAQLVGLESWMADLREEIATNERARNIARLLAAYYRKARDLASGSRSSTELLAAMAKTIDASFTSGGTDVELAEAKNDALLDLYALRALAEQGFRFAAGPSEGWRDTSRIWKAALAGAAIGFLLVALAVLLTRAIRDEESGTADAAR